MWARFYDRTLPKLLQFDSVVALALDFQFRRSEIKLFFIHQTLEFTGSSCKWLRLANQVSIILKSLGLMTSTENLFSYSGPNTARFSRWFALLGSRKVFKKETLLNKLWQLLHFYPHINLLKQQDTLYSNISKLQIFVALLILHCKLIFY